MRRFHDHKRIEIVEHVALDPHRRLEAGAAEHDTVAGGYHLAVAKIGFKPGDDEVQRCFVVDRAIFAPFMHAQLLAGCVRDDKMRIAFHAIDLAATEQRQRSGRIHRIGAELHAGGACIDHDDGLVDAGRIHGALMADHSAISGSRMAGSRVSASAYNTAAAAEKRRAAAVSARLVRITGTRAPTTRPAICASAMKARFL